VNNKNFREELSNISEAYVSVYKTIDEKKEKKASKDYNKDGKINNIDRYLERKDIAIKSNIAKQAAKENEEEVLGQKKASLSSKELLQMLLNKGYKINDCRNILQSCLQTIDSSLMEPVKESAIDIEVPQIDIPDIVVGKPGQTDGGHKETSKGDLVLTKINSLRDAIRAAFEIHDYIHDNIKDDDLADVIVNEIIDTLSTLHTKSKAKPTSAPEEAPTAEPEKKPEVAKPNYPELGA